MEQKPHILFVDDEENILQGMRRGFRGRRMEWDMSFALSGEDAVKIVSNSAIDIIVTDMRMPNMDGAKLLEKVRVLSPDTTRIVLSGYAKNETILKVVGPAHQYFAKPCDFNELQYSLDRILKYRELIFNQSIRSIITSLNSLPSLPEYYQNLISAVDNPNSSVKSITEILEADLGLKSQVLRICNSAFFGVPQHIDRLETAVNLLGLNTIRSLALLEGIFRVYDGDQMPRSILARLCSNSISIAQIALKIAKKLNLNDHVCDLISSAGALSHVGSLFIATAQPDIFLQATQKAETEDEAIDFFERELLGYDHAVIGAYILGLWGFPVDVCEAVALHHNPQNVGKGVYPVLACLHLAQQFAKVFSSRNVDLDRLCAGLDQSFLVSQKIVLSREDLADIINMRN